MPLWQAMWWLWKHFHIQNSKNETTNRGRKLKFIGLVIFAQCFEFVPPEGKIRSDKRLIVNKLSSSAALSKQGFVSRALEWVQRSSTESHHAYQSCLQSLPSLALTFRSAVDYTCIQSFNPINITGLHKKEDFWNNFGRGKVHKWIFK